MFTNRPPLLFLAEPAPLAVHTVPVYQPAAQAKQQSFPGTTFIEVAAAEKKCIDKIEEVEEIVYDEVEECLHSYDRKCHTSYSTEYDSQQEEECTDDYNKDCQITYSPHAENITTKFCSQPLIKVR